MDKKLEEYLARIKGSIEALSTSHLIFRHRDGHNLVPKSKTDDIPLEELVREEILPELEKNHETFIDGIRTDVDQNLRTISEIDQVAEFNLEGALALLKQREEDSQIAEAHKIAIGGLGRAISQINELILRHERIVAQSQERLTKISFESLGRIQDLLDSEKIIALKLRVARAKAREKIRMNVKKVREVVETALPSVLAFLRVSLRRIRRQYQRFRKMSGLTPPVIGIEEKLVQFLTETQRKIASHPFVYQRLFRLEPLVDARLFAGRQTEFELMKRDFSSWQEGLPALMAVVGERGSGRTTLLNFAEKQIYGNFPMIKVDIIRTAESETGLLRYLEKAFDEKEVACVEELENRILSRSDRTICIVENIQKLFLRTVDGFEALERFLLFVSRTHEQVYWVVTCTLYTWRYLNKVINIAKFFQRVIVLEALTSEEIEAIVLKRHRVSGYRLSFELPDVVAESRKFKKLTSSEARHEYLKGLLFEQLNEFASGNITIAILFWLRAIKEVSKDRLVLSPLVEFDHSFLNQLPPEELFTLGALLHHETLTAEQHALVFHQEIQQSALLLSRMHNKGILATTASGYLIHHLLYRSIVRVLKTRNVLQ